MDDFGGGDGHRHGGGRRRGDGGGARGGRAGLGGGGGGGGASFNKHTSSLSFEKRVPKFLQEMLSNNVRAREQGQREWASTLADADGGAMSGHAALAAGALFDHAATPSAPRQRPVKQDELPSIDADLAQFSASEFRTLLSSITDESLRHSLELTYNRLHAGTSSSASSSSSSATVTTTADQLSAKDADDYLSGVKRARVEDADADLIERNTGRHVFRPKKRTVDDKVVAADNAPNDASNASNTIDNTSSSSSSSALNVQAASSASNNPSNERKLKKKLINDDKQKKSMLTFNEDDL
jgi:hypothetical protein